MRDRLLQILAAFVCRWPRAIIATAALLAILCGVYAGFTLRLNANLDDLIARDRPFMADYRAFLDEFGDLEHIIIAVDASRDREQAELAVDALLVRLRAIEGLPAVHGTIEPEEQLRIATRAMSESDLHDLTLAREALSVLEGGASKVIRRADAVLAQMITAGATMPEQQQREALATATLLLESIALSRIPHADLFRLIHPSRQYLASDTGRLLFVHILPVKDYSTLSVIEGPLGQIRKVIDEVRTAFPEVEIGLTGKPVMQYDEMATSNADMTRAAMIAVALCAILFMVMLGGVKRPMLAMIAFGMAGAWTYGFATLAVGQLNLLSLVFMLVLVGVGLDYGIHIINRYQEARMSGRAVRDAVQHAVITAVRGNITGALTSSIVFFMAVFTTFQGLRELGVIAGGGLILCLIAMSVVLPAMLVLFENDRNATGRSTMRTQFDSASATDAWFIRHARSVLAIAAIVTATAAAIVAFGGEKWGAGGRFDDNLLNLQARGLESIEWEHRILDDSAAASWFGASIASTHEQVQAIIERAKDRPTIGAIRSVFDVIQPDSTRRDELRAMLHSTHVEERGEQASANDNDLHAMMTSVRHRLSLIAEAAAATGASDEAARLRSLINQLESIDIRDPAMRKEVDASLAAFARAFNVMLAGDRLSLREALPAAVREQFVSPAGTFLVMLHPRENVWAYEAMQAFLADLRTVDEHVTGVPVTHFESLGEMRKSFVEMSLLALAAIIGLLMLDFRSVRDVLLALTPLAVGMLWMLAAMRVLGVPFNLANFFAVPMLIGLSVDSAVHMLHRHHESEVRHERLNFGRTRRAVMLTAMTTIIGFGALVIAHHRGLQSLGMVMAIGSASCMLTSIFILPALLAVCDQRGKSRP